MILEFSYFQCKDGHYGICNVPPEHMYKDEKSGLWLADDTKHAINTAFYEKKVPESVYSFYVKPDSGPDFRIKDFRESYFQFSWCNLLDLTNVPTPKWEDKTPILVVLDISPKTSYYVYD